jgi:hypothetical protein
VRIRRSKYEYYFGSAWGYWSIFCSDDFCWAGAEGWITAPQIQTEGEVMTKDVIIKKYQSSLQPIADLEVEVDFDVVNLGEYVYTVWLTRAEELGALYIGEIRFRRKPSAEQLERLTKMKLKTLQVNLGHLMEVMSTKAVIQEGNLADLGYPLPKKGR